MARMRALSERFYADGSPIDHGIDSFDANFYDLMRVLDGAHMPDDIAFSEPSLDLEITKVEVEIGSNITTVTRYQPVSMRDAKWMLKAWNAAN
jgi:hypothetical protein